MKIFQTSAYTYCDYFEIFPRVFCASIYDSFKMNYLTQFIVHSGVEISSVLSYLAVTVCVGAIVTFFVK